MNNYQECGFSRRLVRQHIIHKPIESASFRQGLPESRFHGWLRVTFMALDIRFPAGMTSCPEICV